MRSKIVSALSEFFKKQQYTKAVIGISGGIDSAVVACLAVEALGRSNVIGIAMPNAGVTSKDSTELAEKLARNLGIRFHIMPITSAYCGVVEDFFQCFGRWKNIVSRENLQSRLRAVILMAVANDNNALLFSTGNETEDELGYFTLYGDGCGAIAPLGEVNKNEVYELATEINKEKEIIPAETIKRQPSAELTAGQVDPFNYKVDAEIVSALIFRECQDMCFLGKLDPESEIVCELFSKGFSPKRVIELQDLRLKNRFKRQQSAPPLSFKERW
jgi:NAD+ synthase (glutamine-hydrolysing)